MEPGFNSQQLHMGRKPLTPAQKELKGVAAGRAWRLDKEKLDQLRPLDAWEPSGGAEKRAWYQRIAATIPEGGYKETDGVLLESLAEAMANRDLANEKLDAEGPVVIDDAGKQSLSPWVALRREAVAEIHRLLPRLGLTPADRTKLVSALPARSQSRKTKPMKERDA